MALGYFLSEYRWGQDLPRVPVNCYERTLTASGSAYGISGAGELTKWIALRNKQHQIIQAGVINQVEFYCSSLTNLAELYFEFWSRDEGETAGTWPYDRVISTGNLAGSVVVGYNKINFDNIEVPEGAMVVIKLVASALPCEPFYSISGITNAELREYRSASDPSSTGFNWKAQTQVNQTVIDIRFSTNQQPELIFTGDSIISGPYYSSGNVKHASYAVYDVYSRSVDIEFPESSIPAHLASNANIVSYWNTGVNSNRADEIARRTIRDLLKARPKYLIIEGGINDINVGTSEATILSSLISILDFADFFQNTKVCFLGIFPATTLSDAEAAKRRSINSAMSSAIAAKDASRFFYVNSDSYLGVLRGSTSELDDMNASYSPDGVHLYPAATSGYASWLFSELNSLNFFD